MKVDEEGYFTIPASKEIGFEFLKIQLKNSYLVL